MNKEKKKKSRMCEMQNHFPSPSRNGGQKSEQSWMTLRNTSWTMISDSAATEAEEGEEVLLVRKRRRRKGAVNTVCPVVSYFCIRKKTKKRTRRTRYDFSFDRTVKQKDI